LRQDLSVVLDFPANTVNWRNWMRSLITDADVAHELHVLDVPDTICKERLRRRNADGDHAYQVSEENYDLFTSYFVPPGPGEGFNIVPHTPCPAGSGRDFAIFARARRNRLISRRICARSKRTPQDRVSAQERSEATSSVFLPWTWAADRICRQRPPFRFCLAAMVMTAASDRGRRASYNW